MSRPPDWLRRALRTAPSRPGCYVFRGRDGAVLYVGKARDLKQRVQVYGRAGGDGRARLQELWERAASVEWRVTANETEALLLEDRLVKHHQPPWNVLLKDDKSFLLLRLDTEHRFPRLSLARRRRGGGECFGPYVSAGAARRAKRLLMKAFGLRDCSDHVFANRSRPCLQYDVGLCCAPCVGKVDEEEYARRLSGAREVLGGRVADHVAAERRRMAEASAKEEYEIALRARDRLRALEALSRPQHVRLEPGRDFDVLGLDVRGHFALLQYRDGSWLDTRGGRLGLFQDEAAAVSELLSALYRDPAAEVPPEVLVPELPEDHEALEGWLAQRAGRRVRILAPRRGPRRALLRMAATNARARRGEEPAAPWPELSRRLGALCRCDPPRVVDALDVSHLQGRERVASKVRFSDGRRDTAAYRSYVVGGGSGNDDPGAMREVVRRVLARRERDGLPDLLVVDGGRSQLGAVVEVLAAEGVALPVVALAKARRGRGPLAAEERLYLPGRAEPVVLERGSAERRFLERLRDEAHRFAIGLHRRRRENLRLVLEQVPGIGPKRRQRLLDHCAGRLERLRDASAEELATVGGMGVEVAERLREHLRTLLP